MTWFSVDSDWSFANMKTELSDDSHAPEFLQENFDVKAHAAAT